MGCVAVAQDQDQVQVAQVKTKLLKPKLWKAEIRPDHELTTNAACSVLRLTSNRCCVPAAMARTKRKWTREGIEEALLQNALVNATPAEPEETAVKRKRQQRRSNNKRNLIKELNALSVTGTESAAPLAVTVMQVRPVLPAQPTVEQEGKQEEDDPDDHQRQFAAAYAEDQRQAAVEAEPQVAHPSSADRIVAKRARNAEQQRIRRANMTASQTERRRAKDRERQRARRARMTEEQRGAIRQTEGLRQQLRRAQRTPMASDVERERNREQRQTLRNTPTQAAQDVSRESDRDRHAASRADRTTTEVNAEREQNRVRPKAPKRCYGHVNHEDFKASMVTGKDVVDGRHRLPSTTMCPLCQAWKWPAESDFICCLKDRVQLPPLQPAPPRLLQMYGDKEFRRHIRAYNQAFAFTSIGASSSDNTFRDVNQDQSVTGQHGVYTECHPSSRKSTLWTPTCKSARTAGKVFLQSSTWLRSRTLRI
ncbi:unnamed protein product [Phytophthora fragariaefolia]|uniref:Unnamed protein product n=1 Tax=Phytophthora fragariaefolia TaxID=1490495 RepID=A0A9W6X5C4_9STRA|nr:unnamed protein product [Phytophthora fragariaefolia]